MSYILRWLQQAVRSSLSQNIMTNILINWYLFAPIVLLFSLLRWLFEISPWRLTLLSLVNNWTCMLLLRGVANLLVGFVSGKEIRQSRPHLRSQMVVILYLAVVVVSTAYIVFEWGTLILVLLLAAVPIIIIIIIVLIALDSRSYFSSKSTDRLILLLSLLVIKLPILGHLMFAIGSSGNYRSDWLSGNSSFDIRTGSAIWRWRHWFLLSVVLVMRGREDLV